MKASELRIGNIVIAGGLHEGALMKVNGIKEYEENAFVIHFQGFETGEYLKDCHPVPLTEDWLLKFGFGKENSLTIFKDADCGRITFTPENGAYLLSLENPDSIAQIEGVHFKTYNYPGIPVKSVHHLQNLFSSLTGEELKVKEPA